MADRIISRAEAKAQGLKWFFTGRPCGKGHLAKRLVSSPACAECVKANVAKWRRANPEVWRASNKQSKTANQKRYNAEQKVDYAKNPEKYKAAWQRYYLKNRERMVQRGILSERMRRALSKGSNGSHTAADLAAILKAQNNRCVYCRADLRKVKRHVDHIQPLSCGGSNDRLNIQYLCAPCNLSKGAKDPIEFAKELGRLL